MKNLVLLILFISPFISCGSAKVETRQIGRVDTDYFCNHLGDIKYIPLKAGLVNDPVYNGIIASGAKSLDCLVDKLDDDETVTSPIKHVGFAEKVTIGEIAHILLGKLIQLPEWSHSFRSEIYSEKKKIKLKLRQWLSDNRMQLKSPSYQAECIFAEHSYKIDDNCYSTLKGM